MKIELTKSVVGDL